jgi:hypothetical protein
MKIIKLKIDDKKLDINLKFYFFLKYLIKTKLSDYQIEEFLKLSIFKSKKNKLTKEFIDKIKSTEKKQLIENILDRIEDDNDFYLLEFAIRLYLIKDLLLSEVKICDILNFDKLQKLDPLSLEYDKLSVLKPYFVRVNSALLALLFFENIENENLNFMTENSFEFLQNLSIKFKNLKNIGLESNQIFMLMFSESINQSIISDSGSNYEDRIEVVLSKIGIDFKKRIHDKFDQSTEYDFYFKIDKISYGIGAKRTLRERYKQFIKTSKKSDVDVMIQITIGLDLTEEKSKIITENGIIIFVSDEVYNSKSFSFLKNNKNIYSTNQLNLITLRKLAKIKINS